MRTAILYDNYMEPCRSTRRRRLMMYCYLCQRQRVTMSAVAICQGCGAGCCIEHVEEWIHPGRAPGLQPMQAPRIEMLCQRCLVLQAPLLARARRQVKAVRGTSS